MSDLSRPRVVVGYDGSLGAEAALAWAVGTATLQQRPLQVVVAASDMNPVLSDYRAREDSLAEERRRAALRTLENASLGDATVEVRHGPALSVLLRAVGRDDVLVVGREGHRRLASSVGSLSTYLADHAPCPVVVVRAGQHPRAGRIVVGLDGSPESLAAVRFACTRAEKTAEQVVAVHAYHPSLLVHRQPAAQSVARAADGGAHRHVALLADRIELWLVGWLADARTDFPGVDLVSEAEVGSPRTLLVERSSRASLLAVGHAGHRSLADLTRGTVGHHALLDAHCPVAIIR